MLNLWHDLVALMQWLMLAFSRATGSYGVGIILLTLLVRGALFPLYKAQMDSFKRMQQIQPELKRLQDRFKDDKQRLGEEQLRLYKQMNVNPMASCLPMVLQLPLIYAFYDMLKGFFGPHFNQWAIPGLSESFLWLPSLGKADPYYVLPILGGLSTYWQTRISMTLQSGAQQQQMQMMTYLMPVFMFWIFLKLPSGVAVYWVVANIVTIAQQYLTVGALNQPPQARGQNGSGRRGK
jgi:YidC/Oxa1 family membrane protein insertase